MQFINTNTVVEKTPAEEYMDWLIYQNSSSLQIRKNIVDIGFHKFWETKEKAQSICDLLGTDAYELFEQSWKEQLEIKAKDPSWEFLIPPYEIVKHDDGRVTIK